MKRVAIVASLAVCIVASGGVALWVSQGAAQGNSKEIYVRASSYRDNEDLDYEVGDGCSWSLGTLNFAFSSPQLVVRDDGDNVVAMYTFDDGTIEASGTGPDGVFCVDEIVLKVPDASFYTIYLGSLQEIRIVGFAADELPNDGTAKVFVDPDLD